MCCYAGQIPSPPVTGIKMSQFNPLLDNSVLSAQVLWNPAIVSVSMYQVMIYHVDDNLQELSSVSIKLKHNHRNMHSPSNNDLMVKQALQ